MCTDIYQYLPTFTNIYRYLPIFTDIYRYLPYLLIIANTYQYLPIFLYFYNNIHHKYRMIFNKYLQWYSPKITNISLYLPIVITIFDIYRYLPIFTSQNMLRLVFSNVHSSQLHDFSYINWKSFWKSALSYTVVPERVKWRWFRNIKTLTLISRVSIPCSTLDSEIDGSITKGVFT